MKNGFWKSLISSKDTASSKRITTLSVVVIFLLTCLSNLFLINYKVFFNPKGVVDPALLDSLKTLVEYEFYIIISGLGFVTAESFGKMLVEKAKAQVAGNIAVGSPSADNINVGKVEVNQSIKGKDKKPVEPEPPE